MNVPGGSLIVSILTVWSQLVPYGPNWSSVLPKVSDCSCNAPYIWSIPLIDPYMGSFAQPQYFFAAAQENKDLRSPCRGPSSLLTNIFCVDP